MIILRLCSLLLFRTTPSFARALHFAPFVPLYLPGLPQFDVPDRLSGFAKTEAVRTCFFALSTPDTSVNHKSGVTGPCTIRCMLTTMPALVKTPPPVFPQLLLRMRAALVVLLLCLPVVACLCFRSTSASICRAFTKPCFRFLCCVLAVHYVCSLILVTCVLSSPALHLSRRCVALRNLTA